MADPALRRAVTCLFVRALPKALAARPPAEARPEAVQATARALEEACFAAAAAAAQNPKDRYVRAYRALEEALPRPHGRFLEAPLATHVLSGAVSPSAAVAAALRPPADAVADPRLRGQGVFYDLLGRDPRFADEALRLRLALELERGCYNAAIAACHEYAGAVRRQWTCPMFVNIYSAACGRVAANLDPAGSVTLASGSSHALDRLAAGEWDPADVGGLDDADLCPAASEADRREIALRLAQRVEARASSLYACPRCRKRNHTYRLVQVGAADEASSFFCTCLECGENFEGR